MVAPPAISILYGVRTILPIQRFVAPTSGYHLAYGQFDIGRSRAHETTSRPCNFDVQHSGLARAQRSSGWADGLQGIALNLLSPTRGAFR
jgi:hypothetical protein